MRLLLIQVIIAIVVWADARRQQMRYGDPRPGAGALSPIGWAVVTLILPLLGLGWYAVNRLRLHRFRTGA